jgi:Flp pilus assembly protein TadG
MGRFSKKSIGFLSRLLRNQAGNTLAIVAAALIPLAGMIGGGLDISRGYLAKTRLQQACDAGVLAGRKVMASTGVISTGVTAEVQKYVNFNYPSGYLGSVSPTVTPTLGANDQIQLTISTTVPTVVMRLFKKDTIAISATCSARNDYTNIDIVLVLDVTGSMACTPSKATNACNTYWSLNHGKTGTAADTGKKYLYTTEEKSGSVNVSRIEALRNSLANLQTQMATIETQFNTASEASRKRVRWAIVPFDQMVNAGFSKDAAGTTLYSRNPTWFNTTGTYQSGSKTSTRQTIAQTSTWLSTTWDGCVEERATSNAITLTSGHSIPNNLPATAYDLKFDLAPTTTETRWTVTDPTKVGGADYSCPKAMREFSSMTTTEFNDYFKFANGFAAEGRTYLDVGMLWAARLLSRTGLWASDNPSTYHTFPVTRYVIFMTDGVMQTDDSIYSNYAQEDYWARTTTSTGNSTNNHTARWLMTCNAIKNMQTTIYAISFGAGSTVTQDLKDCSSGDGYWFKADDASDLDDTFRNIGENIGSLRLSQ